MRSILNISTLFFILVSFVHAEQPTGKESLVVKQPSVTMHWGPSGARMGDLYINTPVVIEKTDGNWAYVTLQTWVKKDGLGVKESISKSTTTTSKASTELLIEKFTIDKAKEGAPKGRIYLTLTLKNNSPNVVKSWRALLVGQSETEVLFREQLADNTKPIAVGGTTELSFFWATYEEPYTPLANTSPEKLKLELYQVALE